MRNGIYDGPYKGCENLEYIDPKKMEYIDPKKNFNYAKTLEYVDPKNRRHN